MKIARLTSPLLDVPRQSSPRLRHGRRLVLPFHLNLYTLFFSLSLALLPRLPPLLTFLTVLLPGNLLRSTPLTRDLTFPFLSQRPCVAEPEATSLSSAEPRAQRSLTRPSALLSPPLNFFRLPPTFSSPLTLAQTKLPIVDSLSLYDLWSRPWGSCPASGAPWSSAMHLYLGRGRINNNNKTFTPQFLVYFAQL